MGCGGGGGGAPSYSAPPGVRKIAMTGSKMFNYLAGHALHGKPMWDVLPYTNAPTIGRTSTGAPLGGPPAQNPYAPGTTDRDTLDPNQIAMQRRQAAQNPFQGDLRSVQGTLSGYNVPGAVLPSSQWYNSMSPEVKAGVMAPWQDAAKQLKEQMAGMGQLGNASAGVSGAGAAGLGELWSRAGQQAGLQMWNMSQPGLQANWQANLERAKTGGMEKYMDTSTSNQAVMQNYQNALARRGEQQNAITAPWSLAPGFMGGMGSLPFTATPQSPSMGSQLGSAIASAAPAMLMGAMGGV